MKKFIFFLCFSTVILTSCIAQNLSKAIENSFGEKLYSKMNAKLFVKDVGTNYQLILIRTNGFVNDSYDRAIIIFSESALSKLPLNSNDDYEIQIPDSKKYLVIYNTTKNQISFVGTSDMQNKIKIIKSNSNLTNAISNIDCLGYGMSYLTGSWNAQKIVENHYKIPFNSLDFSRNINPVSPQMLIEDPGVSCKEGTCTSGGAGSNSCSITEGEVMSCSVTCNTGYYACCVSSTTRCYCCKVQAN